MYAVIRLRGNVNVNKRTEDALRMLDLRHVNNATLLPKNQATDGMLRRVREFVTWGEVKKETAEKLIAKRGKIGGRPLDEKEAKSAAEAIFSKKSMKAAEGLSPVFRLSPPTGGLKSIRIPYPKGDLGARGEKINELIERMI